MAINPRKMTSAEVVLFCREWRAHLDLLDGEVYPEYLVVARAAIQPDNFGYEQGQLRPDRELARFDLYDLLVPANGIPDALLICRLTEEEERQAFNDTYPLEGFEEINRLVVEELMLKDG